MKVWLGVIVLTAFGGSAFAEGARYHGMHHPDASYLSREIEAVFEGAGDGTLGDLTAAEITAILSDLSVAVQKDMYVKRSMTASLKMPGMGQFMNGEKGSGALYMTGGIVISVGTLVGAYYLLPDDLKFDRIDYLNDSYGSIRTAWEGKSFVELLPPMGVMAGGMLLKGGLHLFSAANAARLATDRIDSGAVTFEPDLFVMPSGMLGMGMSMKY